ncbi:MAG TPA: ATP-binding protein [Sphingomicrobium sp.]|nr:ATP-binding protein [Sphingomicrobium sp.]
MTDDVADDDSLLILAPEGRDAAVLHALLTDAGIAAIVDSTGEALLRALETGDHAAAVITDEALTRVGIGALRHAVDRQPTWSDFPFVVLSRRGQGTRGILEAVEEAFNATVLERPLHPASLVSAARSAIRGRQRQRLAAQHLRELERARAELKGLAETLEAKVVERTRELASANDRLTAEIAERERAEARLVQAQKMEAVGQLTGGLAHDFNNLLTAVVGSLDLLLRRTDDERVRRLAGNALQAAERGAQLTAQLLAFSRRQRLQPTPLNSNEVVTGMGDLLSRTIGPHVRIETRLDPSLWNALADRAQIEVMILNLAINARDAMPSGGRLTISTSNLDSVPPALSTELAAGEYVALSVSDTGMGMSPEVLARAFEPFFTTKEPGHGTGLGLSQLYGFAKQSGGTARIESAVGKGTTVTIYLPRTRVEAVRAESAPAARTKGERLKVLLVDDDDSVRAVCSAMLEDIGCKVVPAATGAEALALLSDGDFSLLLTDIAMPVMSGVELAHRAREIRPSMPVLFATGYADIDAFGERLSEERVVRKPYRLAELAARLHEAIAQERGDNVVSLHGR